MLPEAAEKVWWVGVRTARNQAARTRSRIVPGEERLKVLSEAAAQTRLASTASNNKVGQSQETRARNVQMQTSFGSCPPRRTGRRERTVVNRHNKWRSPMPARGARDKWPLRKVQRRFFPAVSLRLPHRAVVNRRRNQQQRSADGVEK